MKKYCTWCGRELNSWYLTYKNLSFCRLKNDSCLKEYLFEEADSLIGLDRCEGTIDYDMSKVDEDLNL